MLTLLGAFAVSVFMYLVVGRWSNLSRMGSEIFSALGGFGIFYALLAGPLATVDCLSRERREGTLGLLFLTDLKGYDVVLGKMAAASFDMVLGLTAAVPLLALPLLVGGVSLPQFARLGLALADVMFLSLAAGVLASSLLTSGRAALAATVGLLVALSAGWPFFVDQNPQDRCREQSGGAPLLHLPAVHGPTMPECADTPSALGVLGQPGRYAQPCLGGAGRCLVENLEELARPTGFHGGSAVGRAI